MSKIVLLLMTKKGFAVLDSLIKNGLKDFIELVISYEEKGVIENYYKLIEGLCINNNIKFYNKNEINLSSLDDNYYYIAIGWKWIVNKKNIFILHDSLLPKYRGFIPLVNMLINGEKIIGVTAFKGNKNYDSGEIIAQKTLQIDYPIKIKDAIDKISYLYIEIVNEIISKIKEGSEFIFVIQNEDLVTYSIWRDEIDLFINWNWDANKIKRHIDAVGFPYEGARSYMNGKEIKIFDAEVVKDVVVEDRESHIGKVIFIEEGNPIVICSKGLLKITDLRDDKLNPIKIKNIRTRFK